MAANSDNLIWIDLEMTGLDVDSNAIIEIGTIVTDPELNIIAEGPALAISQPDELLDAMDEWNTNQHHQSGLTADVKASTISVEEAEQVTIDFLKQHVKPGISPMCGNSICLDRRYLHRYMPALEQFFHYRHIDVSTIKELAKRWNPEMASVIRKGGSHRALDDIHESIEELRHYYQKFFILPK